MASNKTSRLAPGQALALSPQPSSWGPFYTIREASRMTQVPAHVLRYWQSQRLLDPPRTSRGHRRYRQPDIEKIGKIKDFFYLKGMRLSGVRKALAEESRKKQKGAELPLEFDRNSAAVTLLSETKQALKELLQVLR